MDGQQLHFRRFISCSRALVVCGICCLAIQLKKESSIAKLAGNSAPKKPPTLAAQIDTYPGFKARNPFQAELQNLSEIVIEDIPRSPTMEHEFLAKCYCKTGALSLTLACKQVNFAGQVRRIVHRNVTGPKHRTNFDNCGNID